VSSITKQRAPHEPLYEINPFSRISIEVFYSDHTLETFGRRGAGWFWWHRWRGHSPEGPPTGPFPTSYSAYRHAMIATECSAAGSTPDARTLGERSIAFRVPIMGRGPADN